jgi:ClpX C4-type zinc finger
MVMKKQGVSRRRFLALCGGGMTGIWLVGTGMVRLPDTVVFAMSGSCSFCGKEAREIFGLAGVTYRNVRICDECINLCLEIIVEETCIKSPLPAWAEPYADRFDEGVYDPELLAQLVRRLGAGEPGNRLIHNSKKSDRSFRRHLKCPGEIWISRMFFLRQAPGRGHETHRGADSLHLRWLRRRYRRTAYALRMAAGKLESDMIESTAR